MLHSLQNSNGIRIYLFIFSFTCIENFST